MSSQLMQSNDAMMIVVATMTAKGMLKYPLLSLCSIYCYLQYLKAFQITRCLLWEIKRTNFTWSHDVCGFLWNVHSLKKSRTCMLVLFFAPIRVHSFNWSLMWSGTTLISLPVYYFPRKSLLKIDFENLFVWLSFQVDNLLFKPCEWYEMNNTLYSCTVLY